MCSVCLSVGELARQHGHARPLALLDLLGRALARLRLADDQLGQLPGLVDVLVEPELELGAHDPGDQPHGIARAEPLLGLALELRVQHAGRQHEAGACEGILGHQPHALGLQVVQLDEAADGREEPLAQTGFVRAARRRGDEVHVGFARQRSVLGEGHHPVGALAFGKAVIAPSGVLLVLNYEIGRASCRERV